MGRIPKIHYVTQEKLRKMAKRQSIARVGATSNPKGRASRYHHEGYAGDMYVARTRNKMKAEDKLLRTPGRHNFHQLSNAQEAAGYVYAVTGKKMTSRKKKKKMR